MPLLFTVNASSITPLQAMTTAAAIDYALNRSGPLTSPLGIDAVSFMNPPGVINPWPAYMVITTSYVPAPANPDNANLWGALSVVLHPESRGTFVSKQNWRKKSNEWENTERLKINKNHEPFETNSILTKTVHR